MMLAQTLEVYAAASLKEAFTTIAHSFEASHPGVTVHLQFAGSQTLAAQISNGAPADIFASADNRNLDRIAYDPVTRKVFATNRLVVVSTGHKYDLKGLSSAQRIVLAAPAVPVGGYARSALQSASSKYGSNWLATVNSRVVSEEADVRAVLTKVELGEADVGIVYASDAVSAAKGVFVSPLPKEFQPHIEYPVAVPKESARAQAGSHICAVPPLALKQTRLSQSGLRRTLKRWLPALAAAPLVALLVLPLLALIAHFHLSALHSEARDATLVSARTTTAAVLLLATFGTPLALLLGSRRRPFLEALVTLPAVLPPAAAGLALLLALGRHGLISTSLPFTAGAVVLAQVYVASPFYVRPLAAAFRDVSGDVLEAARLDGAGDWISFFRVMLPLVRRPLLVALTLAWARALGEFGATILFAGNRPGITQTLPLAVYLGFESDLDQAVALSTLLLAVAVGVVGTALALSGRDD